MNWRFPRSRARAPLVASLMLASAVSPLAVSSASAQTLNPGPVDVPTGLVEIPGLPTAPGHPATRGLTLDQARAAYRALAGSEPAAVVAIAADPVATAAASKITAVF